MLRLNFSFLDWMNKYVLREDAYITYKCNFAKFTLFHRIHFLLIFICKKTLNGLASRHQLGKETYSGSTVVLTDTCIENATSHNLSYSFRSAIENSLNSAGKAIISFGFILTQNFVQAT